MPLTHIRIRVRMPQVPGISRGACNRARGLGQCLHGHDHALDIRMADDGNRSGGALNRPTLKTVMCIGSRALSGTLGQSNALQADCKTGGIHGDEHVLQPAPFLADERADRTLAHLALTIAVQQHGGRTAMDPKLVFNGCAPDIVSLAKRPILVHQELGHHKQRQTLDPLRRIRRACKHQMDDVFNQIMLAISDVDFLAKQSVGPICLSDSTRVDQ